MFWKMPHPGIVIYISYDLIAAEGEYHFSKQSSRFDNFANVFGALCGCRVNIKLISPYCTEHDFENAVTIQRRVLNYDYYWFPKFAQYCREASQVSRLDALLNWSPLILKKIMGVWNCRNIYITDSCCVDSSFSPFDTSNLTFSFFSYNFLNRFL